MFNAPHGAVCARLLPYVMEANVRTLQERAPDALALARYREVAAILTGDAAAKVIDDVAWIRELSDELAIPGLSDYGLTPSCIAPVVGKAMLSRSMQGNPITLTEMELTALLTLCVVIRARSPNREGPPSSVADRSRHSPFSSVPLGFPGIG